MVNPEGLAKIRIRFPKEELRVISVQGQQVQKRGFGIKS